MSGKEKENKQKITVFDNIFAVENSLLM